MHVDPDRADRALDELGHLLRYALRQSGEDVTLRQEWEFTRDYLAFEALRLGERLRLETSVSEDALGGAVPPFILQPLVENAVRHGVANSASGGDVAVRIARDQGVVTLSVTNTIAGGAGIGGHGGHGPAAAAGPARRSSTARSGRRSSWPDGTKFAVAVTLPWNPVDARA